MGSYFIAGTDTDVGKTFVTQGLLMAAKQAGISCLGYKPVSAGCQSTPEGLRNDDALILQQYSSLPVSYEQVNPVAFADPVAPHLAAKRQSLSIDLNTIQAGFSQLENMNPQLILVEGAGGWRLPINNEQFLSDFVVQQNMPVILVVGVKLGCLNHTLLTLEAIARDGLKLAGWIANQVDPDMLYLEENINDLKQRIAAPCLGVIPRLEKAEEAVKFIDTLDLF